MAQAADTPEGLTGRGGGGEGGTVPGHPTALRNCCVTGTQALGPWAGSTNGAKPGAHIPEWHKAPFVPRPSVH